MKVTVTVLFLFCTIEKSNAEKSVVLLAKMLSNCSFREGLESACTPVLCAASLIPYSVSIFLRLEKT